MRLIRILLGASALMTVTLSAHAAPLFCSGGPKMQIDTQVEDHFEITFKRARKSADEQAPGPGECAMAEVPLPEGSATVLRIEKTKKRALELLAAAKGGTFQVDVKGQDGKLVVQAITDIAVDDGGGGDDQADADDGGGDDQADADDGGGDDQADADDGGGDDQAEGGMCGKPGDRATVAIPEEEGNKLNVRVEPDGDIIGTVREGKKVTLAGLCDTEAAVGIVADDSNDGEWCRIRRPFEGCVQGKYLQVEHILDGAVGIAKKRK